MSRFQTIDISPLFKDDMNEKLKVAKQIEQSCLDTGFFFIDKHSIDCLDELFERTQQCHFSLTDEEKYAMAIRAYKPDSDVEIAGYYMSIKGKKAVESMVIIFLNVKLK